MSQITDRKMAASAALVKQMLNYCAIDPGAKVTISVEHDNGQKVAAELFDHAALVQSLIDAIDYFIDEL